MTFLHSPVLLLLVLPLFLLVRVWRREAGRLVLPLDHGIASTGAVWRVLLDGAESLPPLLLAIAIVILAGPQRLDEPQSRRKLTNIQLCVDISGSMLGDFGEGTRYDGAMKAIDGFLDYRKGDAAGLTFFGSSVLHWCPLTSDLSAIRCAPPFMHPERAPPWFGGTEIGKALRACRTVLADRPEGDRMIVLVSDGDSSDLGDGAAETIAKEMREVGISVFAILIGVPRIQDEIFTITETTGGQAFDAEDPEVLDAVFARIDQMKKAEIEKTLGDSRDDFHPWCLAGLVLLGLAVIASFGLRYSAW